MRKVGSSPASSTAGCSDPCDAARIDAPIPAFVMPTCASLPYPPLVMIVGVRCVGVSQGGHSMGV